MVKHHIAHQHRHGAITAPRTHHPDCGPVFGAGADLFICDSADSVGDSYSNLPHSYDGSGATSSLLLGDYNATLSEYEVLVPSDSS